MRFLVVLLFVVGCNSPSTELKDSSEPPIPDGMIYDGTIPNGGSVDMARVAQESDMANGTVTVDMAQPDSVDMAEQPQPDMTEQQSQQDMAGCQLCRYSDPCNPQTCENGVCVDHPVGNGNMCTTGSGTCHAGACCQGCWTGNACLAGTTTNQCGGEGKLCQNCDDGNPCTTDSCNVNGTCSHTPAPEYTSCGGGMQCHAGSCQVCGQHSGFCCGGSLCTAGGDTCQNGTCQGCGAPGSACCAGGTCNSGAMCNGSNVCLPCGQIAGQTCCPGSVCGDNTCNGVGQGSCLSCNASNTCACGGRGQFCCQGHTCNAGMACQPFPSGFMCF